MKKLSVVSLFSGAGGLDLGFKENGFETVFATDFWGTACETLEYNNISKDIKCSDIRDIDFKKIRDTEKGIDCLIGGPPCPPFSQSRHYLTTKKSGFEDEESGFAVAEYFRAVEELNPTVFVFENVDGFMYKTHLAALNYLQEKSKSLGYKVFYKVINCANYGVPQTRKRFICIGVKEELQDFIFPEETHTQNLIENANLFESEKLPWVTCGDVLEEFDDITDIEKDQKPGAKHFELLKEIPPGDNYLYFTEKRGYPNPIFKWKSRYWTFLLKLTPDRPSWTIQASFSNNQGPFHWKNRFLRIEEIKRLQTFPDEYVFKGAFKDQWRQIGNAVPPMLSSIIAKQIKELYFSKDFDVVNDNSELTVSKS